MILSHFQNQLNKFEYVSLFFKLQILKLCWFFLVLVVIVIATTNTSALSLPLMLSEPGVWFHLRYLKFYQSSELHIIYLEIFIILMLAVLPNVCSKEFLEPGWLLRVYCFIIDVNHSFQTIVGFWQGQFCCVALRFKGQQPECYSLTELIPVLQFYSFLILAFLFNKRYNFLSRCFCQ